MTSADETAALAAVWAAHRGLTTGPADWHGSLTLEQAYQVQLALLGRYQASGEEHVGWKVGLTSRAIQEQVGVHEPVFGFLLRSGHRDTGALFRHADLLSPRIEIELCFTMRDTLTGPGVTLDQARRAVGAVAPALELVERRHDVVANLHLALADNAQQRAFVTGTDTDLADLELADAVVDVSVNGAHVDSARGTEVLGTPLASIVWLADRLAGFGLSLETGMRVMSGSFTRQHEVAAGDRVVARFAPFGVVSASFQ